MVDITKFKSIFKSLLLGLGVYLQLFKMLLNLHKSVYLQFFKMLLNLHKSVTQGNITFIDRKTT